MAASGSKKQIVDANISKLDRVISETLEKRVAHVAEEIELLMRNDFEDSGSIKDSKDDFSCIEDNKRYISAVHKYIRLYDKLMYIDKYGEIQCNLIVGDTVFPSETVVYLKNPLADLAYSSFSKILKDARVLYKETFSDVCEEVYYSRAPYCILPLENYEDGRLSGFVNMIRKYELKIVLTCNVESANGKITKFALLKRELTRLSCPDKAKEGEYLEIGFNFGGKSRLHEVLAAAMYFGYKLNKVDSLPIYYSEKEYYYDVVFSGKGQLQKFVSWLEHEMPRYEILGIYIQIKTK